MFAELLLDTSIRVFQEYESFKWDQLVVNIDIDNIDETSLDAIVFSLKL